MNVLSDAKTSSNSRKTDTWNVVGEDESQVSRRLSRTQLFDATI